MMNLKWAISNAALVATVVAAAAQPAKIQDRHPAYANDPVVERRVTTEIIHTFEQRWAPVRELLYWQAAQGLTPKPDAPAAFPAPVERPPAAKVAHRSKAGDVCARHGMTKTYTSRHQWRCKR